MHGLRLGTGLAYTDLQTRHRMTIADRSYLALSNVSRSRIRGGDIGSSSALCRLSGALALGGLEDEPEGPMSK